MKLEVGKYYKTRDGRKVGPMEQSYLNHYPFSGKLHRESERWLENGRYYNHRESNLDLVEEWKDCPKLWGKMTDEEKGALLLAHQEGKTIEFYSKVGYEWTEVVGQPAWCGQYAYRVKPEPDCKINLVHNGITYIVNLDEMKVEKV